MIKTFNCGVGFCLIVKPTHLKKIKRFFNKQYKPYLIGKICKGKQKIIINEKIIGPKKVRTAVFISGKGSNLKNLIKYSRIKTYPFSVDLILSNTIKAKGLKYSNIFNIEKK